MDQQKYKELKENCVCKECVGCNKLELPYFTGRYECDNFVQAEKEKEYTYGSMDGNNY